MAPPALTRASTIGPIVDLVARGRGSVDRLFRAVGLPFRIHETPDALIPLRDQLRLVALAARDLGDHALPARMATSAGVAGLGVYGREFVAAPTLGAAIRRGNVIFASTLQSATCMTLATSASVARWTYRVTEPITVGRRENEILALGYMLDLVRHFAGPAWTPVRVELPGPTLQGRGTIEAIYGCDISAGQIVSLVFSRELLQSAGHVSVRDDTLTSSYQLPTADDFVGCAEALLRLCLLEGRPHRAWVARRLDMSVRTLQRRLEAHGTSFADLVRDVMAEHAALLLARRDLSLSAIAQELGYSDQAHFTRAFAKWFGDTPDHWRSRARYKVAGQ
jgi:AraC-like DNA-binding protein